jgi:hypothetical protein
LKKRYQQLFNEGRVKELDPSILGEFDKIKQKYVTQYGEELLEPPIATNASELINGKTRQQIYDEYLREVDAIEAKILGNVDPVKLLMLGEQTFEYSRALRQKLDQEGAVGRAFDITASGRETSEELEEIIKDINTGKRGQKPSPPLAMPQSGTNFQVEHGVDARQLGKRFDQES